MKLPNISGISSSLNSILAASLAMMNYNKSKEAWWAAFTLVCCVAVIHFVRAAIAGYFYLKLKFATHNYESDDL